MKSSRSVLMLTVVPESRQQSESSEERSSEAWRARATGRRASLPLALTQGRMRREEAVRPGDRRRKEGGVGEAAIAMTARRGNKDGAMVGYGSTVVSAAEALVGVQVVVKVVVVVVLVLMAKEPLE